MRPGCGEIQVWLAFDAQLDVPVARASCLELLVPAERARHDALGVERVRRQYLLARAVQRHVLARTLGVDPHSLEFVAGEAGKPALAPPLDTGLQFNLAHSQGLVAFAMTADAALGIDVEALAQPRPRLGIAQRYFSSAEARALAALPPERQPRRFLELWTLKEAYLKAVGSSIAGGLSCTSFDLESGLRFERTDDPDAGRWQFHRFETGSGHLLAVAALGREAGLGPRRIVWQEYRADGTGAKPPAVRTLD